MIDHAATLLTPHLRSQELTGQLVEGNARHVEVFAVTEKPFDGITDLQGCLAWHTPRATATAEHRVDVFHIGIKPITLEVQRGSPPSHDGAALRTGFPDYRFRFFRTWFFIH